MDLLEAILLGLVQGVTEWLPVSSSGHLVFFEEILGINQEDHVLFNLILHAATLVSVSVFLRQDLKRILGAFLVSRENRNAETNRNRRLGWFAIVATVPAAATGLIANDHIEAVVSPITAAVALLITGFLLWFAEMPKLRKERTDLGLKDALIMGGFQAFSIIPGISRSGSTISSGAYLGLARELLAVFSFLMSIPLILAAILYGFFVLESSAVDWGITIVGAFVAAVSGYLALKWLFEIIKKHRLRLFSVYCWAVGSVAIVLLIG